MDPLERLSRAALERDSLTLRAYALELLAAYPNLESVPFPAFEDAELLAVVASLVELFAERRGQNPPT